MDAQSPNAVYLENPLSGDRQGPFTLAALIGHLTDRPASQISETVVLVGGTRIAAAIWLRAQYDAGLIKGSEIEGKVAALLEAIDLSAEVRAATSARARSVPYSSEVWSSPVTASPSLTAAYRREASEVQEPSRWKTKSASPAEARFVSEHEIATQSIKARSAFDVPTTMTAREHYTVTYRVGKAQYLSGGGDSDVQVTRVMRACLEGTGFEIKSAHEAEKAISLTHENVWSWDVEAPRSGKHTLNLVVTGYLETDSKSTPIEFISERRTVRVRVNAAGFVREKLVEILTLLVATAALFEPVMHLIEKWRH